MKKTVNVVIPKKDTGGASLVEKNAALQQNMCVLDQLVSVISSAGGQQGSSLQASVEHGNWSDVVETLQSASFSNLQWVGHLVQDVLGPIAEAQGIAKAVIGIVSTVVQMVITRNLNNYKCEELRNRMKDLDPSMRFLTERLNEKATEVIKQRPMDKKDLHRFRVDLDGLRGPLKTLLGCCSECQALIERWNAGGSRLGKFLRQMIQAKTFAVSFTSLSEKMSRDMSSIQTALAAVTYLKIDEIQKHMVTKEWLEGWMENFKAADARDKQVLPRKMEDLMQNDPEFKEEMARSFEEVREDLKSNFGELFAVLSSHAAEFAAIRRGLSEIDRKMEKNFSDLHEKLDQMQKQGSSGALTTVDTDEVNDKIAGLLKVIRGFNSAKKLLRDAPKVLNRCQELVAAVASSPPIRGTPAASLTLKNLSVDLESSIQLLRRWQLKATHVAKDSEVFFNSARMSRMQDMMSGLRDYQDKLQAILIHSSSGIAPNSMLLSVVRRGTFSNYDMIRNERARQFWIDSFPGRAEVSWGEFLNMMRWQPFMQAAGDDGRARAFFWLKRTLDENKDQMIHIGEWNRFSEGEEYECKISSFFANPIPDEDVLDSDGAGLSTMSGIASSRELEQTAISMGILSSSDETPELADFLDLVLLVDCTGTMKDYVAALPSLLTSLVAKLRKSSQARSARVAFVGYRDSGDKTPLTVHPFTSNVSGLAKFLQTSVVLEGGGGDAAEDVIGGLERAVSLEWTFGGRVARHLIHIGDAPSHGTRYHDFALRTKPPSWKDAQHKWDRFPDFDKDGATGKQVFSALEKLKVNYTFLRLNNFTEKMAIQFQEWYGEGRFRTIRVDSPKDMNQVLEKELSF